jgi:predicted metalloprotease with PDZ domain
VLPARSGLNTPWQARDRLDRVGKGAPLDGLARSGRTLSWTDSESKFAKGAEDQEGGRTQDLSFSLGKGVKADSKLDAVAGGGPAFQAGLATGMRLLAVNMQAYKPERLAAAITANQDGKHPIQLLLRQDDPFRQVSLQWQGGLRYPQLQRVAHAPDRLSTVYAPRS